MLHTYPLNKSKQRRYFATGLAAVVFCTICVVAPQVFTKSNNTAFVKWAGYIGTVLFGIPTLFFASKIFNKTPGLAIDNEGFTDGTLGVKFKKVLWRDVSAMEKLQYAGQQFIKVNLKNPEAYIEQEPNTVIKKMLVLNYQALKTPVNIAASRLKSSAGEVYSLMQEKWKSEY